MKQMADMISVRPDVSVNAWRAEQWDMQRKRQRLSDGIRTLEPVLVRRDRRGRNRWLERTRLEKAVLCKSQQKKTVAVMSIATKAT